MNSIKIKIIIFLLLMFGLNVGSNILKAEKKVHYACFNNPNSNCESFDLPSGRLWACVHSEGNNCI